MRNLVLVAASFGVVLGLAVPAFFPSLQSSSQAGTALQLSLEEAFDASELVVEGRVTDARSGELPDGTIYTDWEVGVERTFWGEERETRTVRLPGGVLASGKGMLLPGMPRLAEGEEVLLLLGPESSDGLRMPTGLSQGKYRIVTASDGDRVAVQTGDHVSLLTARNTRVGDTPDLVDYADLVARLEALRQSREATSVRPR